MNPTRKALDKATRHLHCAQRFADPAVTRDGDQAHILTEQEFFDDSYFLFASYETGPWHWNICRAGLHLPSWSLREAVADGSKLPSEISGGGVALIRLFCQTPLDSPT